MSRRADQERIEEARHQATRNRLIGVGMTEETTDVWIDAWAAQAAKDGVIEDLRADRKSPAEAQTDTN